MVPGACALLLAGGRLDTVWRTGEQEALPQPTNHCDVATPCSSLHAQAIRAPADSSLALHPAEIPAALLPGTLISEAGRPVPVPDPTNLLFQSHSVQRL